MKPADVARVAVVEELDVTPDGRRAVVARRVVRRGQYRTHLHLVDLGDPAQARRSPAKTVQLTDGPVVDGHPRISPDGRQVAFLRRAADTGGRAKPRGAKAAAEPLVTLLVMPIEGGRIQTVAPHTAKPDFGAIGEFAWSPDGTRLAMAAEAEPARWLVGPHPTVGSPAFRAAPPPRARRVTRTDWRWDEDGHVDHWSHLFIVEVATGAGRTTARSRPRQVTSGDHGVSGPTWHPDGRTVAFVADRRPDADLHPRPIVWAVDVDAGPRAKRSKPWPALDAPGGASHPAWSPDGRWLVAIGRHEPDWTDEVSPGLLLAPARSGDGAPWPLTPDLDRPVGNWCDTDLHGWTVSSRIGPAWLDDHTIVATVTDRGRSLPRRWTIDPDSGRPIDGPATAPRHERGPELDLTSHALAVATGSVPPRVVVLGTLGGRAMEVMTVDTGEAGGTALAEPPVRTHTRFGSRWQRRFAEPTMTRLDIDGPAGPIETWIAAPPDAGDDTRLPTIIDIHGGPLGCWAPAPGVEVMLLTGAGYRVALPNIRGSTGYGADWIRPQLGHWGGPDADDVHAVADHLVDRGWADADRLGILGLSYGGFLVNWLVGTTDRFAAAVSENGVTNQISAWANSDYGPQYCREARLGDPLSPEGVKRLWRQSPLRHVANVRTPLLLLQAEADLRCPPQDNEQFFIALRHLGREVEYVLYPEESHVYATAGRPDRRIDRMERVLDWFARHVAAG